MSRRGRRVPWFAVLVALVGFAFIALPLIGLIQQVPWGRPLDRPQDARGHRGAAALADLLAVGDRARRSLFGVPLAWVLARVEFPGRALVRALVLLPLVVPPVVGGVGLFYAFGREGLVGQYLYDWFGIQLTFSTAGVVMAETFVAMPFLVITVEAALRSMDRRYEDAAATLGARPFDRGPPGHAAADPPGPRSRVPALAWARALGEFGATITFAGNIRGRTQTMPLAVYLLLESKPEVAIGLSIVLLAVCVAVLALLRDRWLGCRMSLARDASASSSGRSTSTSSSRPTTGRRSRSSVRTARARRRCSARSPGSSPLDRGRDRARRRRPRRRRRASSSRRSAGRSASSSRTTCSSRTSRCSRTWRSGSARRGADRRAARRAAAAVARAGRARRPRGREARELSGGQAQRVALARAMATEPRLLLLDEPLAALDQSARGSVRRELRDQLAGFPGVRLLVTHDPLDAAALADRLVILEHGRVVQTGTFDDVSARPRSSYVAELVGVNLLRGRGAGDHIELPSGGIARRSRRRHRGRARGHPPAIGLGAPAGARGKSPQRGARPGRQHRAARRTGAGARRDRCR